MASYCRDNHRRRTNRLSGLSARTRQSQGLKDLAIFCYGNAVCGLPYPFLAGPAAKKSRLYLISQMRILLSADPNANQRPSGEKANE